MGCLNKFLHDNRIVWMLPFSHLVELKENSLFSHCFNKIFKSFIMPCDNI